MGIAIYSAELNICSTQIPEDAGLNSTIGSTSDCRSRGCKFEPKLGHIAFVETDHEIISMAIRRGLKKDIYQLY